MGQSARTTKLLQEAIRQLLEAYYEPTFNPSSHGFRAERGCHTALSEIAHQWIGTRWYIEGDVKDCFDTIDHEILLSILKESIHDNRFLRLIQHLLQAGYLENWRYHNTLSGTPQGSIVSPVLANIYLDKLDKYVETALLPQSTSCWSNEGTFQPTCSRGQHLKSQHTGMWGERWCAGRLEGGRNSFCLALSLKAGIG